MGQARHQEWSSGVVQSTRDPGEPPNVVGEPIDPGTGTPGQGAFTLGAGPKVWLVEGGTALGVQGFVPSPDAADEDGIEPGNRTCCPKPRLLPRNPQPPSPKTTTMAIIVFQSRTHGKCIETNSDFRAEWSPVRRFRLSRKWLAIVWKGIASIGNSGQAKSDFFSDFDDFSSSYAKTGVSHKLPNPPSFFKLLQPIPIATILH